MTPIARSVDAAPMAAVVSTWLPATIRELLATTRRIGDEHAAAVTRATADHARYEQTRRTSEELRRRTASERSAREADRALRVTPGPAPAAPSGG